LAELEDRLAGLEPGGAVAVVEGRTPVGILTGAHLERILGRRRGVSLVERRTVRDVMDPDPLVVPADAPLGEVVCLAMARPRSTVYDPLLVADGGGLAGMVSVQSLLLRIAAVERDRGTALADAERRLHQEIADRRKVENELGTIRRIVSASEDALALVDRRQRLVAANEAFGMLLKDPAAAGAVGRPVGGLLAGEGFSRELAEGIGRSLLGENVRLEARRATPDRGERQVDVALRPCREPDGRVTGASVSVRDVTEIRNLEAALRQAQKMEAIGTLAGGIAHDFNNILAAIMGYSELALMEAPEGAPISGSLRKVLGASERARDLVRQILTFSRKMEHEKRVVDLARAVDESLGLLRASLPASIDIVRRFPEMPCTFLADRTQVQQVVMNLCTNAAQAMEPDGGVLTIGVRETLPNLEVLTALGDLAPGRYVELRVEDNGGGIPPIIADRIFDPFFTTKAQGRGTGMGLAVVHGIAKSHGGAVSVESTPGKGSIFRVLFPAVGAAVRETGERPRCVPPGRENVLVVDDEKTVADVASRMLERLGYRVRTHSDPSLALAFCTREPDWCDLVLTDMTMPGMTGEVLARRLRGIRPDLKIILCSGYADQARPAAERLEAAGIRRFMMKPFSLDTLSSTVREVLDA
jgi:PAS domain S-box-containing protein